MEPLRAQHFWYRPWQFLLRHKLSSSIIAVAVLLSIGAIVTFLILGRNLKPISSKSPAKTMAMSTPPAAPKYYSPLTGAEVPDQATTQKQVRAVMIENTPDARPQSGLKEAGVVFEADADGGVIRFAALYQESQPSLLGPVRSLRPYFLDWIAPFDASISHVGGSAKALSEVRNGRFKDLDEFFNGSYYWRTSDRLAPHNVYTSTDKLNSLNASKGYTSSTFTGFPRKDEVKPVHPNASSIDIDNSYDPYNVHYDYDVQNNAYIRSEGGIKMTDREEGQIEPKVVIAIKVPTSVVLEDGYRTELQDIGSGTAYVFQDGTVTVGTWAKASQMSQITFLDSNDKPIALDRGQTWITSLPTENSVSWR